MSIKIELSQGYYTTIDKEDFEKVNQYKWSVMYNGYNHYAYRKNKTANVYLHRFLTKAIKGKDVDHKNGDTLDNRQTNLRICSRAQNKQNAGMKSHNTSGYKGVSFHKPTARWRAYIIVEGSFVSLKYYDDPIDAAKAYDKAAVKYFGEFARLNFPQ